MKTYFIAIDLTHHPSLITRLPITHAQSRITWQMTEPLSLSCPYCGEAVELDVDEGGGNRQAYVQDCPVCCQPWQVEVLRDPEGDWSATLRTEDE